MDVRLILLLSSSLLSACAHGNSYSKSKIMSNDVRFPRIDSKGWDWYWDSSAFSKDPELVGKAKGGEKIETGEDEEFKKLVKAISSLEISKSIELVFDPKIQAFIPTVEIPGRNQSSRKNAEESAIVLLSPKTYSGLKKVFDDLEKEGEKGGNVLKNFKNFQTGRFKSKYSKSLQLFRP